MRRCRGSIRLAVKLAVLVLSVAVVPVKLAGQEYREIRQNAPEPKRADRPTQVTDVPEAEGFEHYLFILHWAAGALARPGLDLAWKLGLLGEGAGELGGFGGGIGGSGPKSGTGVRAAYEIYQNPLWAGVSGEITFRGYNEESVWIGVSDPTLESFARAIVTYDLDRHDELTGLGMDTPEDSETDFGQEEIRVMGEGQYQFAPTFFVGARGGWHKNNLLEGENDDIPNTGDVFGDSLLPDVGILPGLSGENGDYMQTGAYLAVDSRDNVGNPADALYAGLAFDAFRGVDDTPFDWNRWSAEASYYIGLPDAQRVIALRFFGVHQDPLHGQAVVPYYFLSSIGGPSFLRGYDSQRFSDNDLIYLAAEYRRRVWTHPDRWYAIDASIVAETAGVYRDVFDELELGDMEQSFGTEARLLTPNNVDLRMGVGVGSEGARFFVSGGGRF